MKKIGKKLRLSEELQKGGYYWVQHIDEASPYFAYILDLERTDSGGITTTTVNLRLLVYPTGWIWSRPTKLQVIQQGKKKPIVLPAEWSIGSTTDEERTRMIPNSSYHAVPPEVWTAVTEEASALLRMMKDSSNDHDVRHLANLLEQMYAASKDRGASDLLSEFFDKVDLYSSPVKAFLVSFSKMQYDDEAFVGVLVGYLADKLVAIGFSAGKRDEGERD